MPPAPVRARPREIMLTPLSSKLIRLRRSVARTGPEPFPRSVT